MFDRVLSVCVCSSLFEARLSSLITHTLPYINIYSKDIKQTFHPISLSHPVCSNKERKKTTKKKKKNKQSNYSLHAKRRCAVRAVGLLRP